MTDTHKSYCKTRGLSPTKLLRGRIEELMKKEGVVIKISDARKYSMVKEKYEQALEYLQKKGDLDDFWKKAGVGRKKTD